MKHPLALTEGQMQLVMTIALALPTEKRDVFLQRVAAQLKIRNIDLEDATRCALIGLRHDNDERATP